MKQLQEQQQQEQNKQNYAAVGEEIDEDNLVGVIKIKDGLFICD